MIKNLRLFVAISDAGSQSEAAKLHNMPKSTVSRHMTELEKKLGAKLFKPGKHGALTSEGERALLFARDIVDSFDELLDHEARGALVVGAIATAQHHLIPDAARGIRKKHPRVRLALKPGISRELQDAVILEKIDMALLIRPPESIPPDCLWISLFKEPIALIAPRRVDISLGVKALLATEPFIRYNRQSYGSRDIGAFLRASDIAVHETMELDELPIIARMVANDLGVSIVPLYGALSGTNLDVQILPLHGFSLQREVGILIQKKKAKWPVIQTALHLLFEQAEAFSQRSRQQIAMAMQARPGHGDSDEFAL